MNIISLSSPSITPNTFPQIMSQLKCFLIITVIIWREKGKEEDKERHVEH